MLRNALAFTGYSPDEFNTHSLRIGAATQSFLNDKWSMEIIMLQTVYSVEYVTLNFLWYCANIVLCINLNQLRSILEKQILVSKKTYRWESLLNLIYIDVGSMFLFCKGFTPLLKYTFVPRVCCAFVVYDFFKGFKTNCQSIS